MFLYHGSNVKVERPLLLKNQRELDFGKGFYTTSDLEQASRWAKRTALRLQQKDAIVSVYEMSDKPLDMLRILKFDAPDGDWLQFVVQNRKGILVLNEWDLVIGPVANDQTASVIDLYVDGIFDENDAIKRLLPQKLKDQYVLKTEPSLNAIRFLEVKRP